MLLSHLVVVQTLKGKRGRGLVKFWHGVGARSFGPGLPLMLDLGWARSPPAEYWF